MARELDVLIARRGGRPKTIVSDNGTELTSEPGRHYIAPGEAHAERLRRELEWASTGRVLERDALYVPAEGAPRARTGDAATITGRTPDRLARAGRLRGQVLTATVPKR